jgi:fumarate hydratase class II
VVDGLPAGHRRGLDRRGRRRARQLRAQRDAPDHHHNVLHCARTLGDACEKQRRRSIQGTELDQDKVTEYVGRSLMLATALSPHVGYDKASAIAHRADDEGSTLREAALALGVSAADFDRIVDPKTMVGNPRQDLGLAPASDAARK